MRNISGLAIALCTFATVPAIAADSDKSADAAAKALVGRYELVSGEENGQPIPAERLKGATVRIAANAISTYDKDEKETYVATYEIDTSSKPWKIHMTATLAPGDRKGAKASGVIEKQGETVRLAYALPGGQTPTEFKGGEKQHLMVLKKLAD